MQKMNIKILEEGKKSEQKRSTNRKLKNKKKGLQKYKWGKTFSLSSMEYQGQGTF